MGLIKIYYFLEMNIHMFLNRLWACCYATTIHFKVTYTELFDVNSINLTIKENIHTTLIIVLARVTYD